MTAILIICLLALGLALLSFRGEGSRAAYFQERLSRRLNDADCPPATVIVPVKGADEGLRENLAALAAQDYPNFELIVPIRDRADLPDGVLPAKAKLVIAGAGTAGTAHKITNLLAAVDSARPETAVFAFADSDGQPGRNWLRGMVAELSDAQVGAATGYRWYVPQPSDAASNLRSAWNAAIAGMMGPGNAPFCWGGAMAITRANFERLEIRRHWLGQISDDYLMARAVHKAGLRVAFAPAAVVPCPDHAGFGEFLSWGRRQLIITKVYSKRLWVLGFIAHLLYVAALVAGLVHPREFGLFALAIAGLGMVKAHRRARLFHSIHQQLRSMAGPHVRWVTVATVAWLLLLLSSASTNVITWRGVRYRLRPPS